MGRQLYLERLALGRSGFEAPEAEVPTQGQTVPEGPTTAVSDQLDGEIVEQRYDDKGRSINPSTDERNKSMRNAQNAVLALVGVVESKDHSDRTAEIKYRYIREARERILGDEHERGEELVAVDNVLQLALARWPEALISRVQAGLYSSSTSFADIVISELKSARGGGLRALLANLLPGAPASAAYALTKLLFCAGVAEGVGRVQERWVSPIKRRKARNRVILAIDMLCEALFLAIDVALLPLQYHAETQKLGLAPVWPIVPHWRSFVPSDPSSTHSLIWRSAVPLPVLGVISSPAVLLLLGNFLRRDEGDEGNPIGRHLTRFKYPAINAPYDGVARPDLRGNPFGLLIYQGYILRAKLLKWFQWHLEYIVLNARRGKVHENNHLALQGVPTWNDNERSSVSAEDETVPHWHRSTALAHLPATCLADRMDEYFATFLMLPLTSLGLRAVTNSFLASSLPKTPFAIASASHFYRPFGGGAFATLLDSGLSAGWKEAGSYLSRLGLSFALHCSTEIGIFFIVYKVTCWQGIRNYDWGNAMTENFGRTGGFVYRTQGERPARDRG